MNTKAEHVAIYRNAFNQGKLSLKEFEAFMHCIDAQWAINDEQRKHALAHLKNG